MSFSQLILLTILSFLPSFFWIFFYYYYSPRFTTPRGFLVVLFFLGMVAAGAAIVVENGVFSILPDFILETFSKYFFGIYPYRVSDVLLIFALTFFVVAPVEELLKFFVIRLAVKARPDYLDQTIDGIKFGLVVGLGFAVIENGIYFQQPFFAGQNLLLFKLFFLRLFISTLGHSLYTGIIGYYLGLSHFYKLYSRRFLLKGLFFAIAVHTLFNFFLLVNIGFFSIAVLIVMLLIMFKWYQDRKSLELFIIVGRPELVRLPILTERTEFESILAKNKVTFDFIKKLNLCPFCLKKQDSKQETCSYCGKKLERKK